MLQPTTKVQYQANQVVQPSNLFSHPDQQLEWQNQMNTSAGSTGWAGRIADKMNTQYNPGALVPMIASISGDTLFCNGEGTSPVAIGSGGASKSKLQRWVVLLLAADHGTAAFAFEQRRYAGAGRQRHHQ